METLPTSNNLIKKISQESVLQLILEWSPDLVKSITKPSHPSVLGRECAHSWAGEQMSSLLLSMALRQGFSLDWKLALELGSL